MPNGTEPVKRAYRSPLRRDQAAATRQAVIDAAGKLFAEKGYVATSVEDVAAEAGVSRATVFTSVGGKPELLKLAYDVALVGDGDPVPLVERPESRRNLAERDPAKHLAGYVKIVVEIGGRISRLHEAIRAAAHADPTIRDLWEKNAADRRRGSGRVAYELRERDGLREGLDLQTAGDVVWVLNDPGLYHLLVDQRGWSPERFRTWLTDTMCAQLLPPPT